MLGDARTTLIDILDIVYDRSTATAKVDEIFALIRAEAEAGAKNAIPQIKTEVEKVVKNYVLPAAAVAGGIGLLAIVTGVIASRKCKRCAT